MFVATTWCLFLPQLLEGRIIIRWPVNGVLRPDYNQHARDSTWWTSSSGNIKIFIHGSKKTYFFKPLGHQLSACWTFLSRSNRTCPCVSPSSQTCLSLVRRSLSGTPKYDSEAMFVCLIVKMWFVIKFLFLISIYTSMIIFEVSADFCILQNCRIYENWCFCQWTVLNHINKRSRFCRFTLNRYVNK